MQNPKVTEATLSETIERKMTEEELAQRQIDIAEYKTKDLAEKAEASAKAQAKAAAEVKLAALGLTTDDLRALGL